MKRSIIAILLIAAACSGGVTVEDIMSDGTPRLVVNGNAVFTFTETGCQEAFNAGRHEYCAMTDNASDFFSLRLDRRPSEVGEPLSGDLRWTTETGIREMKNVTFKVMKLEGDTFWLGASGGRLKVIGRVLE